MKGKKMWESNGAVTPKMRVINNNGTIKIEVEVPGFKKEELGVTLEGDHLVISGLHSNELNGSISKEVEQHSFSKRILLPVVAIAETIKSSLSNGVLTIVMKTSEPNTSTAKRIDIE